MTLAQQPADANARRLGIDDVLALHTFTENHGSCFAFSPDGSQLAFCKQGPLAGATRFTDGFLGGIARGELYILDLATLALRRVAPAFDCGTPAWSPCGRTLAFCAATADAVQLGFVQPDGSGLQLAALPNLDFSGTRSFAWLDAERLACVVPLDHGSPLLLHVESRGLRKSMAAWERLTQSPEPTASAWTTQDAPYAPRDYLRPGWPRAFVVYDRVERRCTPAPADTADPLLRDFIDQTVGGHNARMERGQLRSRHALPGGALVAVHAASDQALFLVQDGSGTRLVLCGERWHTPTEILRTNTHLDGIAAGRCVDLQTAGAEPQRVRVLLPPGEHGRRALPAVMWVYPGGGPGPAVDPSFMLHEPSQFNLQLLAARGYAVIEPTMALPEDRSNADVPALVAAAAQAAAAACTAAGLVDPARLHVMGHSRGGWAAMSLLTTTGLFRSGIASAGVSNAISLYGACDPRFRYEDAPDAQSSPFQTDICEEWFGMAGPPEQQLDRYARCSPVLAASKIQAPLLLVHADQDFFPMAQAEEMYAALRRLGKPATLLRYWGEGHMLAKPQNIADLWARIFDWLDRHG
ncbi:S9 family peptidase [Pseudorhodoferax sp.]|uniref:S9 family peptidase n=1 Tax=Pseudorhodoferax sp. TaxID=1993553 RepID=UPI002DD66401|nr:prolyl oligopeptidase family serine peptidase [Pseudorhodoferax sp.]